jgi:hypothetical protein
MTDPSPEHLADGPVQGSDLSSTEGDRTSRRSNPRPEERLVRVDVPDARNPPLIQEKGLDLRGGSAQSLEHLGCEHRGQRLDADLQRRFHSLGGQNEHLAELPDISVVKDPTLVETQFGVRVLIWAEAVAIIGPEELARHPQSDDQALPPQMKDEKLPPPVKPLHPLPPEGHFQRLRGPSATGQSRLSDPRALDSTTFHATRQVAADHFDFRKLRHRSRYQERRAVWRTYATAVNFHPVPWVPAVRLPPDPFRMRRAARGSNGGTSEVQKSAGSKYTGRLPKERSSAPSNSRPNRVNPIRMGRN